MVDTETESAGVGVGTVTVTVVNWVKLPLVPVTVIEYVPDAAGADMLNASVAEPPAGTVTDGLARDAEPDAAETERLMVPLKPLIDETVMVELPDPLGLMVKEEGLEETVKVGVGGPLRYGMRLFA